MAMAQTKIFPWFFDLDNGRMVIDARWFDHVGIPRGDCSTVYQPARFISDFLIGL